MFRLTGGVAVIGDEFDKVHGAKVLFYVGFDFGGGLGEAYVG